TSGTSLPDSALSTADSISASATISGSGVSNPWLRKNSTAMGPERSSYSPVAARVDATITIPVRDIGCYLSVAGLKTIGLYNAAGFQRSTCRDADEMRCFHGLSDQMRTSSAEDMRHRCAICLMLRAASSKLLATSNPRNSRAQPRPGIQCNMPQH